MEIKNQKTIRAISDDSTEVRQAFVDDMYVVFKRYNTLQVSTLLDVLNGCLAHAATRFGVPLEVLLKNLEAEYKHQAQARGD